MAQLGVAALGHLGYPYVYDVLIAAGYGLMLPLIAVLHVRHAPVRQSGAILGTISGTAAVAVGLSGSANVDLRPAALFVLGMWWWTIGKMWVETRVVRAEAGTVTMLLGALALAAAALDAVDALVALGPSAPYVDVWSAGRIALGAWLVAIASLLARAPDATSGPPYHR